MYEGARDVLLAADLTQAVTWIYVRPQGARAGTGRDERAEASGEVLALDAAGKQLTTLPTGQVRFSQLTGDWSSERALLARDGAGVLLADCAVGEASWVLRNGGDVQLHLLGGGAQLWAILPDGIAGILAHKLVKLAPQLAAAQVLPREQLEPVRTAVEALGWDWKSTVISPLSTHSGRVTLFEASDPGSELAELDWSPTRKHVTRLLAARPATDADAELAQLPPTERFARASELLAALGWHEAQPSAQSAADAESTDIVYALRADSPEGCSPGEFALWQGDNVLLTLDAATEPLPGDALPLSEAQSKALAAITANHSGAEDESGEAPVTAEDGGKVPPLQNGPAVESVSAGWLAGTSRELLPEAEGEATPAYEVVLRSELPECREWRVLLNARTGEVITTRESSCSPLHLAAVR